MAKIDLLWILQDISAFAVQLVVRINFLIVICLRHNYFLKLCHAYFTLCCSGIVNARPVSPPSEECSCTNVQPSEEFSCDEQVCHFEQNWNGLESSKASVQ